MADTKPTATKAAKQPKPATEEKLFTIPLRKQWLKVPKNKRAKRSINTIRAYLSRHMKIPETEVKISTNLNDSVWIRGAGKPPGRTKIKAYFDAEAGMVFASLPDEVFPIKDKKGKSKEKSSADKHPEVPSQAQGHKKDEALSAVKEAADKAVDKATSTEEVKKAVDKAVAEAAAKETEAKENAKKTKEPADKVAKAEPKTEASKPSAIKTNK